MCDREKEINDFIPQEYWTLDANLTGGKLKKPITFKFTGDGKNKEEISGRAALDEILSGLQDGEYVVKSIKESERNKKAPLPFTTSTLQQEASSKLNFATSKTMRIDRR